jgi:hypothetical protein
VDHDDSPNGQAVAILSFPFSVLLFSGFVVGNATGEVALL